MKFEKINNAIIDIGSNSIRMLIFRKNKQGNLFQVNKSLRYTNLVHDITTTGYLSEDAINRNLEALEEYQRIANDYDVHHVYVYGTNAMREAKNSSVLVDKIKERFGLDVHIISGETEAEYGFYGVSQMFKGPVMIFDIGGGSTEIVSGDEEIKNKTSLLLGCVRTSEQFIHDQNNINLKELTETYKYAYDLVSKALEKFELPEEFNLVGIGGTITTLSSIIQKLPIYDSSKINNSIVTIQEIKNCILDFVSKDLEERKEIIGLSKKRADNIVGGSLITLAILNAAKKKKCSVCDFDNMEGAAYIKFILENPKSWDHQNYKVINETK